ISWSNSFLSMLIRGSPYRAVTTPKHKIQDSPENAAQLTNWTQYASGVEGVAPLLDEALRTLPEANPQNGAGQAVFIEACSEEVQAVYDTIWTNLKK
ncbi:spermidine/putrescine transport system substrate-binding protein, partial [Sulfitobacter litoralis]